MSAGKGDAPRNLGPKFRENYDRIFAPRKFRSFNPDRDIDDEIDRICAEEPFSAARARKLAALSKAKSARLLERRGKRTVPPHP